ncbi:DNA polymerase III subunit epsilon [Buchnera aphidicola]|uniref:DNA polymerase III subunit epsilon n=1 Tax=Buchnera aphidicola subsp. Cinara cedri (strain Cc) TaxID=372461 RepID=Q057S0_BUCCC|nr:DNA polymerase III subunit epsilon [Buchnera aphidicola]ABJ90629.1 DNA polymerase III, e subunit [Buchnera aphidicola BCc]
MIKKNLRQVFLDIETTGMNKYGCIYLNHKIIEIGIIETINRKYTGRYIHYYLYPQRSIESSAYKIHGISESFLSNKPTFKDIYKEIFNFIKNSEIIVHNSNFDISFLDYEFFLLNIGINKIKTFSTITDTLFIARKLFPGKKNNLDALCARYKITNINRNFHSALLDAKILMKLYMYMTSIQKEINFSRNYIKKIKIPKNFFKYYKKPLKIIFATKKENQTHLEYMKKIIK